MSQKSFEHAKERLFALANAAGRDACVDALAVFGVKKLSALSPCEFESFAAYADALIVIRGGRSISFPSGATLVTQGEKIVGRVDPAPEPKREPLPHFNQQTKHDPFGDGFIVTKGAVEVIPTQPSPSKDPYPAIAGLLKTA